MSELVSTLAIASAEAAVDSPASLIAAPTTRGWFARLLRSPSALIGGVLLLLVVLMALSSPLLFPGDPLDMVAEPFLHPGVDAAHLLGSDMLGRDLLSGIFHGARVSLLIAVVSTLLALVLGISGGLLAGYYGGLADALLMRVTEFFQTIPSFLFALAIVAVVQPTLVTIALAIGVTAWPSLARLVRAEVLKLRHSEMVQASAALGATDLRIMLRDILPNTLTPILVSTSLMVATAILTESSLAFLGLGDPNAVSWGNMVGSGREVIRTDWYITTIPGIAIVITVLALNLLGDGLADVLDPRDRK
ncbi:MULTISPECIES: ABC transporter permease [unclassified Herbaspirillum]|uniref:ABC transporter permease n=1 Tax=unclassified Herbaspirillum TaxID=2624150 RepID=UPI000E2F19F6|nr:MULTISPECIES: ABC transporter permease [unclassified Herbaspirillum]RFB67500.1 ABC transporter permease [Herbaspirillum sp. 3R-3a1]TFI05106.1 ABC transporter permease [Herbaspirillum sp. 3R11]TFI12564.1 ABC transporter permease [Herbaspirillum sp. 3R-11]TFI21063.1 ABC transporter permease [Herbaspirillum sp. 3C11]